MATSVGVHVDGITSVPASCVQVPGTTAVSFCIQGYVSAAPAHATFDARRTVPLPVPLINAHALTLYVVLVCALPVRLYTANCFALARFVACRLWLPVCAWALLAASVAPFHELQPAVPVSKPPSVTRLLLGGIT